MKRTHHLLTLACTATGVSALVWGPASLSFAESRPKSPVTLTGVRVAESSPQVARGALNIPPNFDPFGDTPRTSAPPPTSGGGFFRGFAGEPQPKALFGNSPQPNQQPYQQPYAQPYIQPITQAMPQPGYQPGPGAPANRGVFSSLSNWGSERLQSMRSLVSGQPNQQQPQARVGQMPTEAPPPGANAPMPNGQPPVGQPPLRATLPNGNPAIAGRPAYRWYGWGTTTPGQNPYAPSGEYPVTSAQWYSMTGATPGAFPIPVTYPFRAPPGYEAPAYAVAPAPNRTTNSQTATLAIPPATVDPTPSGPRPIAETPPFRYTPGEWVPPPTTSPTMIPSVPPPFVTQPSNSPLSSETPNMDWQPVKYDVPPRRPSDATWQPSAKPLAKPPLPSQQPSMQLWPADDTPLGPRVRSQMSDALTMSEKAQRACGQVVRDVEVKRLGEKTVIVRFRASSAAQAKAAADTIGAMAEFQADTVTFDVLIDS